MKQTMSTAAAAVAGAFVCVMRLLQTRKHEISRDPGEHDAGHADFKMKRSDVCCCYQVTRCRRTCVSVWAGKGFACWVNQLVRISLQSSVFPEDSPWNIAREKEKNGTDKAILTAAHPHQNVLPKKGAAKKGPDLPPHPARRGRVSPSGGSPLGLARGTTSAFQQQTLSLSQKKDLHLSISPGLDRQRQKTSRRLPAIGLVLGNSPRDGHRGSIMHRARRTGGRCLGSGGVWVGMTTCYFHPEGISTVWDIPVIGMSLRLGARPGWCVPSRPAYRCETGRSSMSTSRRWQHLDWKFQPKSPDQVNMFL